jgi:peptide/nickel transport system ATP-binding protein
VVGLVGESGSGKTTLGRAIVGLAPGQSGEIVFEGTALAPTIKRRSRDVQRRIQMVFQSPDSTLNPRHKVGAILRRSIKRLGGTSTLAELAERVRIEPRWLDQFASRLSGGQKQRVAIARAFAGQPSLVVCDEPVSALDVSVQAAILNLLGDLQDAQDTSYLFISHDLAVVHYLADRIAVMYLGQIVEQGPAADVFRAPHHPYTEALVSSIPHLDDDRPRAPHVRIEGEVPSLADPPPGCRFHTRCPHRIEGTCDVDAPPWRTLEPGHEIRCHLPRETLLEVQTTSA